MATIVDVAVEETDRDIRRSGSTTIKRHDLLKGFEPNSCYYIGNSVSRLGREISFVSGPPPDLVIEVDITSDAIQKFPLFGAVGICEVWRFDGERVRFYCLVEGQEYSEVGESVVLPPLTADAVSGFLEKSAGMRNTLWLRLVREWIRQARQYRSGSGSAD